MNKRFVIIDGNAIIHRAYHALPPMASKDGAQVNAVFGFSSMLLKIISDLKPEYLAVSFDVAGGTFRDEVYTEYKATRVKADQDLYDQIPLVYEVVEAFDIPIYTKKGYEADDVIGTIVKNLEKSEKVDEIIVSTGDRDLLQLATDKTHIYLSKKGISDMELFDAKKVLEKYGFPPEAIVDYKALRGDPSDNIPGIRGIGEKTAEKLIKQFGSLENIYKNVDKLEEFAGKRVAGIVKEGKKDAEMSRELAEIVTKVPDLNFDLKKCETQSADKMEIAKVFQKFGFNSLLKRSANIFGVADVEKTKEKIEIIRVKKQDAESVIEKIKNEKIVACKEILSGENVFEAKINGFVFAIKNEVFNFVFSAFDSKTIKKVFEIFSEKNLLICHDAKRLVKVLDLNGVELRNDYFDLMIASYLINSGTRAHDIESILLRELGVDGKKKESVNLFGENEEKAIEEIFYFFELYEIYHKLLKEQENDDLFHKIEMPLVGVLARMEENGISVDANKLKAIAKETDERLEKITKQIWELAGEEFNVASSVQLRDILFEKMELPTFGIKKGKTGYSTASSELEKLRKTHKIIPLIEEHRELSKIKNTYVDVLPGIIHKKTGRIHTDFNQAVTTTGRLSSSEPNLQNIPVRSEVGAKIREAFAARKGFKLLGADYSQIELRVVASLSGDSKMISVFKEGKDIHTETAALINGVSESDVTKKMRSEAKEVNFGVLYGMGSFGLSGRTGISEAEAREFIERYFENFSGVKKYLENLIEGAKENGFVETLFGRRRYIPELKSKNFQIRNSGERMAINMPIQGTAADMIKMAMIEIDREMREKYNGKIFMLLQVHDELIFEVKNDFTEEAEKFVREKMENIVEMNVPIIVNVSVGDNWGELK